MAKQPRKNLSGKEALYLIKQNRINQAWLADEAIRTIIDNLNGDT